MLQMGNKIIIRTVTHYFTGEVQEVDDKFVVLSNAAWVADTGRWAEALAKGTMAEVEPYPAGVAVSLGAIVDISPWQHDLPTATK